MNQAGPESDESHLAARLRAIGGALTKSEAIIAQWLIANEATVALESGASIAAKTGVSEITVSRFLKRAGFKGLAGLKEELKLTRISHLATTPDFYLRLIDGGISAFLKRDAEAGEDHADHDRELLGRLGIRMQAAELEADRQACCGSGT